MENISQNFPRFTVIIPQKNRAEYLEFTIKSCMLQEYPNFEIIVSDDCSDDNSVEVANALAAKDNRIKVFAHKKHLGMRDNFEFALSQVKPGFIIALGGDDGIAYNGIQRMYEILKETGKELLTWPTSYFTYPDNEREKGKFILRRNKDVGIKIIKSEDFLNKVSRTLRYQTDECPMFYVKGVASTKLVDKVRSRTPDGSFYYCPTPDGFSGIATVGEVEDYAYTNEPLTVMGTSPKSQGKLYKQTDEYSRKEAEQFFNDNIRRTMHRELASQQYSPLQVLMTADYLLTARDLPNWPGKFEMFSFESLICSCFKWLEWNTFENDVLVRELKILKEIAKQHDLLDLFEKLNKTTKRRLVRTTVFDGFIITPSSIMFSSDELKVNNVYEAAMITPTIYSLYKETGLDVITKLAKRVIKTYRNSKSYKIEYLPIV